MTNKSDKLFSRVQSIIIIIGALNHRLNWLFCCKEKHENWEIWEIYQKFDNENRENTKNSLRAGFVAFKDLTELSTG